MKFLGPSFIVVLICAWIAGPGAAPAAWWRTDEREEAERLPPSPKKAWNPLAPIDAGMKGIDRGLKKLGSDTKRFFANAGEALRRDRREADGQFGAPPLPWLRPARPDRQTDQKPSWLGSLFEREESRPSSSVGDFLDAGRLDP